MMVRRFLIYFVMISHSIESFAFYSPRLDSYYKSCFITCICHLFYSPLCSFLFFSFLWDVVYSYSHHCIPGRWTERCLRVWLTCWLFCVFRFVALVALPPSVPFLFPLYLYCYCYWIDRCHEWFWKIDDSLPPTFSHFTHSRSSSDLFSIFFILWFLHSFHCFILFVCDSADDMRLIQQLRLWLYYIILVLILILNEVLIDCVLLCFCFCF